MNKVLINGQHALYSPALASQIGRSAATVLQQAHYWMSIKGGKTIDGVKWFWKTYAQWAAELSLSVSTVRRAIALLKSLGLIAIEKLSAKTYYQANWYTVNTIAVKLFLNEHMDMSIMPASICSQQADDIKEFTPKEFSSQQHAAAVEKKYDEAEWGILAKETETLEQTQVTHFVDEPALINSTSEIDCREDSFSAVAAEPVEKSSQVISPLPVQGDRYVDESELDDLADFDESQVCEVEVEIDTDKPSKYQIKEICTELRRLRINPQPCLGVVKKHWANVQGAIARVKDAIAEGWCDNPTGLFINSCKSGAKGKNTVTTDVSAWFEWARKQRIVLAMSGNVVYTPDGEAIELQEMMKRFPVQC